ncbi:hypothetical protein FGIG_06512 [Fasciola gigantica]|uniref:Uncharacterized protein n=1 Tax=Fasciola gigantica TaxID=46835 RepID=A0A504YTT8_FASGI|nr:hypothetical protein FGIG_06512 [Fasciola gigantica]
MPRGKRKCVHPPLTFLHPPFSKQLGELAYVAPTEIHPEVKTTNADEKCSWISPTFKLDLLHNATNRGKHADRTKPTPNSTPVPRKTLEFVSSSDVRVSIAAFFFSLHPRCFTTVFRDLLDAR